MIVPERCTDDIVGLEHFTRVFHSRFGSTGPILYIGSLDQAIQDSVLASRHEVEIFFFDNLDFLFLSSAVHWLFIFIMIVQFVQMSSVLKS